MKMKMFPALEKRYGKEQMTALEAQRLAHEISFGPIVFQVSRLMVKFDPAARSRQGLCLWLRTTGKN